MERTLAELERSLGAIRAAPSQNGVLRLIVRRPAVDEREVITEGRLDPEVGLVGDTWRARGSHRTPGGPADPAAQLTLVNARGAEAIAGDIERWPLAGDQLFVDFDISETACPPGTRLAIGEAEIEFSSKPHTGCEKYAARFGTDALRFVSSLKGKSLRLRGANTRVVHGGLVRVGDEVARPLDQQSETSST